MNSIGKEIAKKILKTVKTFEVPIGPKKSPEFARKQERKAIQVLSEKMPEYTFEGIADIYAKKHHGSEIPKEIETKFGDILIFSRNPKKLLCFIELKVGTRPNDPNSIYFGAPSLLSIYNKVKEEKKDGYPRLILCIDQNQEYRICDPGTMVEKTKNLEVWIKSSSEKEKNPIFGEFNGKVKVGKTKDTASTENELHVKDFFPSYLIRRHEFDVA